MSLRQLAGECFALCCAIMLGLAAGAVWLLPTVYLHRPLPWLAVPAGWLLGIAIRQWVHGKKWNAALLAALATAVASVYIRVLITTVNISAMTDYGLFDAAHTAGWPMLLDFTRLAVSRLDVAWSLAGIAVAAAIAMRSPAAARRNAG